MSLSNYSETERLNPGIWKVTSVAVLGSFLSQIDATVVNVSLSSLAVELHSSLSAIQWVTSGYLLALALMLPLNGWMVDRIGAKALYLWWVPISQSLSLNETGTAAFDPNRASDRRSRDPLTRRSPQFSSPFHN
jgi:MFS family permease